MRPGTTTAKLKRFWIVPFLAAVASVWGVSRVGAAEPSPTTPTAKVAARRAIDPAAPPLPGEIVAALQHGRFAERPVGSGGPTEALPPTGHGAPRFRKTIPDWLQAGGPHADAKKP